MTRSRASKWDGLPICSYGECDTRVIFHSGFCSRHTNECECLCGGRCSATQRYITGHSKTSCARCEKPIQRSAGQTHCTRCRRTLSVNPTAVQCDTRQKRADSPVGKAWCVSCRKYRSIKFFGKNSASSIGIQAKCKSCQLAYSREKLLLRKYGMTLTEYESIKEFQGNRCYICRVATGATKALAVDHDHHKEMNGSVTRESLRGLLCGPCNHILGMARDDPEFFARAIEYLVSPPAQQALGIQS
jgi:hypothetical protein